MYKYITIFCFFLISLSVSAQFEKGTQEHKGMRYKIRQHTKGQSITDSSIIQVQMRVFNSLDSLLQQTYTEEIPALVDLREEQVRQMSLVKVLMKAKIGDSLTVFTLSDSIYKDYYAASRPPFISKGSWVRQEFRIVRNYTPKQYEEVQLQIEERKKEMQEEYIEKAKAEAYKMQMQSDSISKAQVEYIENTYFVEKEIIDYKKTESGLFYKIDRQGKTDIQTADKVKVHYKGSSLMSGKQFDSSYDRGEPFEFPIGVGQVIEAWDEGIPIIGRGGKGTLYLPSNLAYGSQGAGSDIQPNEMLIFEVEVADEYLNDSEEQAEEYEQTEIVEESVEVVATEDQEVTSESYSDVDDAQQIEETVMEEAVIEETESIEEEEEQATSQKDLNTYYVDNQEDYIENVYLKLNDITDYKKTKSGLFYRIEKQGVPIKKGEEVKVHYEGTLLMTGEQFDSSFDKQQPIPVSIGTVDYIKGWEEGIPLIGRGGKGILYVPAKLAYGKKGLLGLVPPNAILIYRIEILEK